MTYKKLWIYFWSFLGYILVSAILAKGYTYEQDVYAINTLYAALGTPLLPGWIAMGGDPCSESWQGVQCVNSNITKIILNGANLNGQLGDGLKSFSSIITIDLSNNLIGGSIPENLPSTIMELFLSDNQFTGEIPSSLSGLTLLSAMSLNNNLLTGDLPDVFQLLTLLTNLDLSFNNLTGPLPPSMTNLSSLTTMRIQNNQFTGKLDVLQDLPLRDLNIENNLFSGPVPAKLFNIPTFKKDGNPFNITIAPASSPSPVPLSGAPNPGGAQESTDSSGGSSVQKSIPARKKGMKSSTMAILIALAVVVSVIVLLILAILVVNCLTSKLRSRTSDEEEKVSRRDDYHSNERPRSEIVRHDTTTTANESQDAQPKKGETKKAEDSICPIERPRPELISNGKSNSLGKQPFNDRIVRGSSPTFEMPQESIIDSSGVIILPPPPVDKVIVTPIHTEETSEKMSSPDNVIKENLPTATSAVISFSVATLQQYTSSFSENNVIRDGRLGKVYQADLPDGKKLMVMKLDNTSSKLAVDDFFDLVVAVSELRHPNVLELVGYCAEYEQRLLVYNSFSRRTLHDVLHGGDDAKGKISWTTRLQIALGAARALEYLHEGCQPPVIHQNFESASVLLDDALVARVSDCGLASISSSTSASQLSGRIHSLFSYEAPEIHESGIYSDRSDVYSFGVVMLELLTGRRPFDSSRPRAEQYLVRWASSQLYDMNTLSKMVDPSIVGRRSVKSLSRLADIISKCIQREPEFRPPMSEVVQDLTFMVEDFDKKGSEDSNTI